MVERRRAALGEQSTKLFPERFIAGDVVVETIRRLGRDQNHHLIREKRGHEPLDQAVLADHRLERHVTNHIGY